MNNALNRLINEVLLGKELTQKIVSDIEQECTKIANKVDDKSLENPEHLKSYVVYTYNQLLKHFEKIRDFHNHNRLPLLQDLPNEERQYIGMQCQLVSEIGEAIGSLQADLLEHLIAFYPKKYSYKSKELYKMHPTSPVHLMINDEGEIDDESPLAKENYDSSGQDALIEDLLSKQITHSKRHDISKAIHDKYKNRKGKFFRVLYEALISLDLFPPNRSKAKFFRCLKNEGYYINNPQILENRFFRRGTHLKDGSYQKTDDEIELDKVVEFLTSLIKEK